MPLIYSYLISLRIYGNLVASIEITITFLGVYNETYWYYHFGRRLRRA